jgi:hypothetical protein
VISLILVTMGIYKYIITKRAEENVMDYYKSDLPKNTDSKLVDDIEMKRKSSIDENI